MGRIQFKATGNPSNVHSEIHIEAVGKLRDVTGNRDGRQGMKNPDTMEQSNHE